MSSASRAAARLLTSPGFVVCYSSATPLPHSAVASWQSDTAQSVAFVIVTSDKGRLPQWMLAGNSCSATVPSSSSYLWRCRCPVSGLSCFLLYCTKQLLSACRTCPRGYPKEGVPVRERQRMIASTQSYRVGTGPLEIWAIVAATAPSRWWVPHSRCGAPRDALLDGSLPYHCWAFCSMVCWRGGVGPRSSITHQLGGAAGRPPVSAYASMPTRPMSSPS